MNSNESEYDKLNNKDKIRIDQLFDEMIKIFSRDDFTIEKYQQILNDIGKEGIRIFKNNGYKY